MSEDLRSILRDALLILAVVAAGLVLSWIVIRVQKPETQVEIWDQIPSPK